MRKLPWLPSKRFLVIYVVTHTTIAVSLFLWTFGTGMTRFETGQPQGWLDAAAERAADVLLSPVFTTIADAGWANQWFPGLLGYLPILFNSLLWGVAVWVLFAAVSRIPGADAGGVDAEGTEPAARRHRRSEAPARTLSLAPPCSECGLPAGTVVLTEHADGWHLRFQGVAGSGNGTGDRIPDEKAQAILDALSPPHEPAKIQAAGFYDDFGFCTTCAKFYCSTHWNISDTGGGTCPAGHFKSLDPHWQPDWDEL